MLGWAQHQPMHLLVSMTLTDPLTSNPMFSPSLSQSSHSTSHCAWRDSCSSCTFRLVLSCCAGRNSMTSTPVQKQVSSLRLSHIFLIQRCLTHAAFQSFLHLITHVQAHATTCRGDKNVDVKLMPGYALRVYCLHVPLAPALRQGRSTVAGDCSHASS